MGRLDVSLDDKFDIAKHQVLLNGTQALVRLMIAQRARDETKGWNTAGYVTGYRGSPLGAVDFQMKRAAQALVSGQYYVSGRPERGSCCNSALGRATSGITRRRSL